MAVYWRLKALIQDNGIQNAAQLHRALLEELGCQISPQALSNLLRESPEALKMPTAQMICTLFQVSLQDFMVITPEPKIKHANIIQPYRAKPKNLDSLFVDPSRFI